MAFDGVVIANIVHDMQSLVGARISKIAQPEKDELLLTFKTYDGVKKLMISANASLPLVYFTEKPKENPLVAPNFCMLLRKHIGSGRVLSITQPSLERIITMEIEHLDEMGDPSKKFLIVELMGKHSNIIFTDYELNIIDSIKKVPASVSSVREVLPGRKYFLPDELSKLDTLNVSFEKFVDVIGECGEMPISKILYTSYAGISPVVACEICYRVGIDPDVPLNVADFSRNDEANDAKRLYNAFATFAKEIKSGNFNPSIYFDDEKPVEFSSLTLSIYSKFNCVSYDTASEMLEAYFSKKEIDSRMRQKSFDLRKIASAALSREVKKLDLQLKQMKDTKKKDKYRIYGELLRANAYSIPAGAKNVSLENFYEDNIEIVVPLDENLSAQENANKYFDKYQKLRRTAAALEEQISSTEAAVMQLREISEALNIASSEEELAQIKAELVDAGFIKKSSKAKGGKNAKDFKGAHGKVSSSKCQPVHFITADGYDIYVGKNNYQNEIVTFQIADANDWWFHAKGIPGSHVVVKNKGVGELPDNIYEIAGSLAAVFSSAREGEKVDIDYTEKKNIKKPAAYRPGLVIYHTNYSLTITAKMPDVKEVE